MKTFLAGYFYDWSRGDYYLNTRGITEEEAEAWEWAIDKILNEKNYKTGKWYRIKFDDLPELRRCANCGRLFNVDARRMEFCANIELCWRCDEQGLLENGDEIHFFAPEEIDNRILSHKLNMEKNSTNNQ